MASCMLNSLHCIDAWLQWITLMFKTPLNFSYQLIILMYTTMYVCSLYTVILFTGLVETKILHGIIHYKIGMYIYYVCLHCKQQMFGGS